MNEQPSAVPGGGSAGPVSPGLGKPAPAGHPIHALLRERWSPRAFADRPVPVEALASLFEAARWAPSSFNEQPWAYLVAPRQDGADFQRLLACLVPGNQAWASAAPVLALSVAKLAFDRNGRPNRHAFHDVGLASAQLTLQAAALGLAVHQMAGFDVGQARRAYGIPEGWEPAAAIALGYPADPVTLPEDLRQREVQPRRRKGLEEFVFSGSWGRPAALAREPHSPQAS
jgi:nitroreductase